MRRVLPLLLAAPLWSACDNSCQAFCQTLADYADECGTTFSQAEIDACMDDYADATGDDLQDCRLYGQPETLRREWTCEDVNLYRDDLDAGGDTDTDA